ncbi:unnamed protein product [Lota lota]
MTYIFNLEEYYDDLFNSTNGTAFPYIVESGTESCNFDLSPTVARLLCFTYIIIFNMAIPGNVLVGLVICVNRRGLTPSDVYLFHLTIADFLLALTLPFWATKAGFQSWIFGDFMCKFVSLITEANFYTSILFLVCISIDRYITIVCASSSRIYRKRYCSWIACVSIWALGVALALPSLVNEAFELNPGKVACAEPKTSSVIKWKLATRLLRHVVGFLLPLVVMVTCYGITIARLLRTRSFKKHRAMRVIMAVVAAFLLCWMPFHLAVITDTLMRMGLLVFDCAARRSADTAEVVTHSLALAHCCINPVLYAIVGERFWGNLAKIKIRRDVVSRSRSSRSTSQTSEGNGPVF